MKNYALNGSLWAHPALGVDEVPLWKIWFRIGTVVVDSLVVRICRGSVGPIWRRETVTQGTAEMIR